MSQHDYVIDNASGSVVRGDINSALAAIKTFNSGSSAPTSPSEGSHYYYTTTDMIYFWNGSAWIRCPVVFTAHDTLIDGTIVAGDLTVNSLVSASQLACDESSSSNVALDVNHTGTTPNPIASIHADSGVFTGVILNLTTDAVAGTGIEFLRCRSDLDGTPDTEFYVRGDGEVYADGGTAMNTPADYAEMFEWKDGNPDNEDRVGYSVVADDGFIRVAAEGEDPIGVISGRPGVLGDAAWGKWPGKHVKDAFGRYKLDRDGRRILNKDYNPEREYVPRMERKEWDAVGLVGKLRIRKGQVTGARWIKLRDITDNVEEWLVR